jgi:hypothetical protein
MDIFSVEQKERLTREEAAARLHAFADMLARQNRDPLRRAKLTLSSSEKRPCNAMQSRFSHAAEWSRTITGVSTHKALNLARLPVPPQPPVGPGF